MASVGSSVAAGEPVRHEKIPRAQRRESAAAHHSRDAADKGASASIASITDFLNNLSDGAKNPKANMNAMRALVQAKQSQSEAASSDANVVLLRSGDVRPIFCRSHVAQLTLHRSLLRLRTISA